VHACGNPLHDIPLYLIMALPFLAPVFVWLRTRFSKRCGCGHDHAQDHEHV